jgi:molecular chaperone DnaK
VYQVEKVLRDNAEKISADDKAAIENPLNELKAALQGNDVAAIKTAHEAVSSASQAFSQKLYEQASRDSNAAGTSASGQAGGETSNDDEIIDAEIVDEEK